MNDKPFETAVIAELALEPRAVRRLGYLQFLQAVGRPLARTLGSTVILIGGASCASLPSIRVVYDGTTDLGSYRTFGFFDVTGTDRQGYESLVTQQLKSATRRQMEARGYRYSSGHPDLLVNFNANLVDKVVVSHSPLPPSEYYGYRSYETWRSYDVQVRQFKEGTLNIDVVDVGRSRLVWEGIASGAVTPKVYDNRQAAIEQAVELIFLRYPVRPVSEP